MSAPPYSEPTEAALIGAAVTFPDRVLEAVIATELQPAHFYVPRFGRAWEAVCAVHGAGEPVDALTVGAKLGDEQTIKDAICESSTTMPSNAPAWAVVVINRARARAAIPPLEAALRAARAGDIDALFELIHDVLDAAEVERHD